VAALIGNGAAAALIGRDAFYGMADLDLDTALDRLQAGLTATAMTEDAAEGIAAFVEKREPRWR
jgi:enoyl-CoA hydratase/carnithine racemase